MINAISLNPKYNVSFYGNKKIDQPQVPQRKLDVSIYGEKTANTIPFAHNYNVSFTGNKTYITGHRNPDTDSICSAIAVEYLANAMKTTDKEYLGLFGSVCAWGKVHHRAKLLQFPKACFCGMLFQLLSQKEFQWLKHIFSDLTSAVDLHDRVHA